MKLILALAVACTALGTRPEPQLSASKHAIKLDPLVLAFLESLDLKHYTEDLARHEVDYELLLEMNDSDLQQVGVYAWGARKKIMRKLKKKQQFVVRAAQTGPALGNFSLPWWATTNQIGFQVAYEDVNGDGLVDFLASTTDSPYKFGVFMNTGTNFCCIPSPSHDCTKPFTSHTGVPVVQICSKVIGSSRSGAQSDEPKDWKFLLPWWAASNQGDFQTAFQDLNGDGLVDILASQTDASPYFFAVYMNTGTSFCCIPSPSFDCKAPPATYSGLPTIPTCPK
jgi:hypothetical protein